MNYLKRIALCTSAFLPLISLSSEAAIVTWDFTVEVDTIYRDDANVIDDSIIVGSLLNGSFSYDDGLTDSSPPNNYVDYYADSSGTFQVDGLGVYSMGVEASVVHQSSRDIVGVTGEYRDGTGIWEKFGIGFLDYTQSYDNGVLPLNWDAAPVDIASIEFDYTYDTFSDCCYDSWLAGHLTSIERRPVVDVSEPATFFMLGLGLFGVVRRRQAKK